MSESFETFMTRREEAARAFVKGDGSLVAALSAQSGQATFFDPGGGFIEGAERINEGNREGAKAFGPGGTTHFEIKDKEASGDLAFWTGYQMASVEREGQAVPMKIRITEIFRREGEQWWMIHRHASMAQEA